MAQAIVDRGKKEKGAGMTQDIIEMARQAGIKRRTDEFYSEFCDGVYFDDLEAFAKLVAAKEREACAKVCDSLNFIDNGTPAGTRSTNRHCAAAIRARGKA
jgi:hypothetical protein